MITRKVSVTFRIIKVEFLPHLKRWSVVVDVGVGKAETRREAHVSGTPDNTAEQISQAAVSAIIEGKDFSA